MISTVGGIERVNWVLASYFIKKGIEVSFLYYGISHSQETDLNESSKVFFLPNQLHLNISGNAQFLIGLIHKEKIDILINQGGVDTDLAKLLKEVKSQSSVVLISVIHRVLYDFNILKKVYEHSLKLGVPNFKRKIAGMFPALFAWREYRKYNHNLKTSIESSDCFIVPSKGGITQVTNRWSWFSPDKIKCIPNPLSYKESIRNGSENKQVMYVGRLENVAKRLDRLVHIWKEVETEFPEWKLKIIGGSQSKSPEDYQNKEETRLKELSGKLGLKNISFVGHQDPKSYYEDSQIFCMTSSHEGFGLVLTEAMQHGIVPVVFNSFESAKDIIDHNKNGILVEPFSINLFAEELKKLMGDERLRETMSIAAVEKSREFRIDKIGEDWIKLFEELMSA